MKIPLIEPSNFRYLRINPYSKNLHLLVPMLAGINIGTDNTCKLELELKAFFKSGAVNELASYKNTLEFHLSLLEEGDAHYLAKKERLAQINLYLDALKGMRTGYLAVVDSLFKTSSNLYGMQLRPRSQDPYSKVKNRVFTINRSNDFLGNPLSSLYNKMYEVFPEVTFGRLNPREQLIEKVLKALPDNPSFETIQIELAKQYGGGVSKNFFKEREEKQARSLIKIVVDKAYVDEQMGYGEGTEPREYIEALIGYCAPNFQTRVEGSPFYGLNEDEKTERLSIITQFYLGLVNIYCRSKGISEMNFGEILDKSPELSGELVHLVAEALKLGADVEPEIIEFVNKHKKAFALSGNLKSQDKDAIQQKFESTYRTVTATKENPYMDDFMILDTEAKGENALFFTNNGLICADFSHIAPVTPETKVKLDQIRSEALAHQDVVMIQPESTSVEIEPEALLDKLNEVQLDTLPAEIRAICQALPAFKVRTFLDDVAKGKQDKAEEFLLGLEEDKQTLLRTSGKFTDYSGRTFKCTAFEYAYWAQDTHMLRMLERHMNDDTKALMLEKINEIERSGLTYEQHGVSYKNAHYDRSFVLKNLSIDEFHDLKTILGQSHNKLNTATQDNYKEVSFTATEYETLKTALHNKRFIPTGSFYFQLLCYVTYPVFFSVSFFLPSPAKKLSNQLKFDFCSLITALDRYVTHYYKWTDHERDMAWLDVGKAQRDIPAHYAQEYCMPGRPFEPVPLFNEAILPRGMRFINCFGGGEIEWLEWFPLTFHSSSGLGFDFSISQNDAGAALTGMLYYVQGLWRLAPYSWYAAMDLAAIRGLDIVRTAEVTRLRECLNPEDPAPGLSI